MGLISWLKSKFEKHKEEKLQSEQAPAAPEEKAAQPAPQPAPAEPVAPAAAEATPAAQPQEAAPAPEAVTQSEQPKLPLSRSLSLRLNPRRSNPNPRLPSSSLQRKLLPLLMLRKSRLRRTREELRSRPRKPA